MWRSRRHFVLLYVARSKYAVYLPFSLHKGSCLCMYTYIQLCAHTLFGEHFSLVFEKSAGFAHVGRVARVEVTA